MFTKFAFVLLIISLSGVVKAAVDTAAFTANVETSVQNLLGVYCLADSVLTLEDAADEFSYYIRNKCRAARSLATELDDARSLIQSTTNLLKMNDGVCRNSGFDEYLDSNKTPPKLCASNVIIEMGYLLTKFEQTQTDIETGLTASYSSVACVRRVMNDFKYVLDSFESRISTCAELAAAVV